MRIWVTGIGLLSPLGRDVSSTFAALLDGHRAFGPVTLFDPTGCRAGIAAQVPGPLIGEVAPAGEELSWSRTDAMAVLAARQALAQARLSADSAAIDLVLGGTTAGMLETEAHLGEMHHDAGARRPLRRMLSHPLSAPVDRVQADVGPFRTARTVCSACSSGAVALMLAAIALRTGRSKRVLAGAADGLCRLTYSGFSALGALSPEPCRPFDAARNGLNLGEGACLLVLETDSSARARGVEPIAELRGWATGSEAHHITNPEASGETAARVMVQALKRAGLTPADIDYVNAHGTATRHNDAMEAVALQRCFGDEVERVAVSSSKGHMGHTLGAAGAIESAISVLAVSQGWLPPTVGLSAVDPDCQLAHVTTARRARVRAAMSNSFGFGGSDAVVIFSEPECLAEIEPASSRPVYFAAAATAGPLGAMGTAASAGYVNGAELPTNGAVSRPAPLLDTARARRIDPTGRMAASLIEVALNEAGVAAAAPLRKRVGAVVGTAFGMVDDCAAFMQRIFAKGPRFASPAAFPNLLPSSPVAHAAIYHRLRGPVFACTDLGATAECAAVTAVELVAAGEADMMLAGGVEKRSLITEAVLSPLCSARLPHDGVERGEGGSVLLLASASALEQCGARPLARVVWAASWRGNPNGALSSLPVPTTTGATAVLAARDDAAARGLLAGTDWSAVEWRTSVPRAGGHEGAGGMAAAAAVALLATGKLKQALLVGVAPDRGHALLLEACGPAPEAR